MNGFAINGCRLWDPRKGKVVTERNVIFNRRWNISDIQINYPKVTENNSEKNISGTEIEGIKYS